MEKDLCVKGWNWGTVKFGGESCGRLRSGGRKKDEGFQSLACFTLLLPLFLISCQFVIYHVLKSRTNGVSGTVPGAWGTVLTK